MAETRQHDPTPGSGVSTVSHVNVFQHMPGGQFPNGGATTYVAPDPVDDAKEK